MYKVKEASEVKKNGMRQGRKAGRKGVRKESEADGLRQKKNVCAKRCEQSS